MKTDSTAARLEDGAITLSCPDHGHRLVPIHRIRGGTRFVMGWTCPEPYCEHVRLVPRLLDDPNAHDESERSER
ncbi:hypothetical protein Pla163_32600 [Planctomycetes bacterium Pla163]|uniref:Uncharacterized protein n=1 Tax=Rohdeia mirabilis TaxID=2528008 RepID=A0A518D3R1_9BACT|nr:hypothetical protein Pla163_32600 [Planctomycetes bacterium Pla163]